MRDGFVIMVDFRIRPGAEQSFAPLIAENARLSVRDEPGCRRFDVVVPQDDAGRVLLYEIYDDEAAFDAHCRMPHFISFDRDSAPYVESKHVIRADLVVEG